MGCAHSRWSVMKEVQLCDKLTERQIQVVRDTWDLLTDDMDGTGYLIFTRLFHTDKEMKNLFLRLANQAHGNDLPDIDDDVTMDEFLLKKHAHVVMEALGAAVECLEDSVFLSGVLVALGQIHAGYHVRAHYLPRLWPAISYALGEVLQDVFTEEVEETWRIVFNYIISKMREGLRMERGKTESSNMQGTSNMVVEDLSTHM